MSSKYGYGVPGPDYVSGSEDKILNGLIGSAPQWNPAATDWSTVAKNIMAYVDGGPQGASGNLASIWAAVHTAKWQGTAADAFDVHVKNTLDFGRRLAGHADRRTGTADSSDFCSAAQQISAGVKWAADSYTLAQVAFPHWCRMLADLLRNARMGSFTGSMNVPDFAQFMDGLGSSKSADIQAAKDKLVGGYSSSTTSGAGDSTSFDGGGSGSGVLTIQDAQAFNSSQGTYDNPSVVHMNFTLNWNTNPFESANMDLQVQELFDQYLRPYEYYGVLRGLIQQLGTEYRAAKTPAKLDESKLVFAGTTTPGAPTTPPTSPTVPPTSPTSPQGPKTPTANGRTPTPSGSAGGQTGAQSAGVNGGAQGAKGGASIPSTSGSTSGYTPTTGGYTPTTFTPGTDSGSVYTPAQNASLASFTPSGVGGGIGSAGGFAGGAAGLDGGAAGGSVAGGLASGAGDLAGAGVAGGVGGAGPAAGAAGGRSGMPMSPMAGAGGGKENKNRNRTSYLPEDEDVWGAGGGDDLTGVL